MKYYSEDKTIQVEPGVKLYYNIHRSDFKKKPTLICIHGLGGDAHAWTHERSYLHERGYSTLACDLRGHGLSDHPDEKDSYTLENLSLDVHKIIEHERIHNPILIGHCLGGMVAMHFAATYADIPRGLMLVDTNSKPPFISSFKSADTLAEFIAERIAPHMPQWHLHSHKDPRDFIGSGDFNIPRIIMDVAHTSLPTYFLYAHEIFGTNLDRMIEKISCKTRIVSGGQDTVFPSYTARQLADKIDHSSLKFIHNANHIVVLNNPIALEQAILDFVEKC